MYHFCIQGQKKQELVTHLFEMCTYHHKRFQQSMNPRKSVILWKVTACYICLRAAITSAKSIRPESEEGSERT